MTNETSSVQTQTRRGRTFALSLGASFAAIAAVVAALLIIGAPTADATVYTMTNGITPFNWSDSTRWSPSGVPGTGDTAIVLLGTTITIDTNVNGVILNLISFGATINVPAGGTLKLEPSSSLNSANNINVTGGSLIYDTGTTNSSSNVTVNTGTLNLTGNLTMVAGGGTFTWNGGQITGSGTLKNPSGNTLNITGTGGGMTLTGATIDNLGAITYSSNAGNSLSINSGAHITIESGGSFQITGDDPIQSDLLSSPSIDVLSGGGFGKGGGTSTTVGVTVNNAGTVSPGTNTLILAGGGTHTGAFSLGTGVLGFNSGAAIPHTFNSGASVTGSTGLMKILGGNFNVNTLPATPLNPSNLNQVGGVVGGTGELKIAGIFNWTGGIQNSSGTTVIAGGATANLNGSAALTLDTGRVLSNSGTINYAPTTAVLSINNGAKISNTGLIDLQNDASINSTTPASSSIDNTVSSQLKKSAGVMSSIACAVNFAGTSSILPNSGMTIAMGGGGTLGGSPVSINLSAAGSVVQLAGGTFAFTAGAGGISATGPGKLQLTNTATLSFLSGPLAITNFEQDNIGTLLSSSGQALAISGTFDWTGGTIDGNNTSPTIVKINGPSGVLNMTGSTGAMTLTNTASILSAGGTLNYNALSNGLTLNNGATIVPNTGAFNYTSGLGIASNLIGSPAINLFSAGLTKTSAGTVQVDVAVNVAAGSLTVNGGTLRLNGGGTSTGTISTTVATDRIEISGAQTYTINSGTNVTGSGRIAVFGNLALNTGFGMPNLELNTGGTVTTTAAGILTINGTLYWNGGTFSGPGSVTLANTATGNLTALTGPPTLADGLTFNNNGGISYNPTQSLTFKNSGPGGATLNNGATGTFDVQGSGSTAVTGAGHSFNVLGGTVKKSAGASAFLFTIPYNQSGGLTDVPFASAIIGITGGGSFTGGTMQAVAASSEIAFNSTPAYTVNGGAFSGTVFLKGGTLTAIGNITAPVTFNQTAGTFNGSGNLVIPNASTCTMTGGSLIPALVSISSGGQLTLDSTANSLTLGPITNNSGGNVLWSAGSNLINVSSGSGISNAGIMDLRGSGTFGSAVAGLLSNTGTLKKTVGTGTITMAMPVVIGAGTLSVQSGTLSLASGNIVSHGGTFDVQNGATLSFNNGGHAFNAGSSFTTATGTVSINSPSQITLNTNLTIPELELWGGRITGPGNLSTTSDFYWDGGTMDGAGTTTVTSGGFDFMTGPMTLGRNLTVPGSTTFSLGTSALTVQNAVTITSGGTFDIQGGNVFCSVCAATFHNNGTLQFSGGTDTFAVPVTGTGTLVVANATFNGQAAETFSSASIDNGSAQFTGNPVTIGSITNAGVSPGVISVMGGATTIAGTVGFGSANSTLAIYAGTLTLNGTTSAVNFALNAGTVNGSGNITAGSSFVFNSGALGGSGTFTSNGTGALSGAGGAMTLSRSLINGGTMTYSPTVPSNILTAGPSVTITNNGSFDFLNENLAVTGSPVAQFVNSATGTFRRIAGTAGALNFDPVVSNAGTTLFNLGTTNFTNGFTQTAGTTTMSGGDLSTPVAIAINGGTLNAYGTITGNLTNGGIVNIRNNTIPAALAVTSSYTQGSGGTLNVMLNGSTAGLYSQLNVTNNVTLAGTLSGTVGYAPINGDMLLPLTFGGRPGGTDFSTKTFTPLAPGVTFNTSYVAGPPQALQILVSTPTADLGVTQAAPASALQGQNVTVMLTITNAGPAAATATVTDSYTNATFVSATASGGGNCSGGPILGSRPGIVPNAIITATVTCTFPTLANGATATVMLVLNAGTVGTITNNASVNAGSTVDPNSANNTAPTANITVTAGADLSITKTSNSPGPSGSVIYVVRVTNNGPSTATGLVISDPTPAALTFVSATGACVSFPCNIASLANGSTAMVTATYSINSPGAQTILNTASVTSTTSDPNTANNSATATTNIACPTSPNTALPGNGVTGQPANGTLVWSGNAPQFKVYLGPAGSGCQTLLGTTSGNSMPYTGLQPAVQYEWRVEGVAATCPTLSSSCATFTTAPSCAQPPAPTAPASGATISSPIVFNWSVVPGASDYHLFASVDGGASLDLGSTTSNSLTASVGDGTVVWYVVANVPTCGQLQSPSSSFTACNDLAVPIAGVVANAASGQSYDVAWDAIPGASKYEVDEAADATFANKTTTTVTTASATFQHNVSVATAFLYRVRAFGGCKQQFSAYSNNARVVLVPVAAASPGQSPNANVPAGSTVKVIQTVFIPGFADGTFQYAATVDQPWLSVQPSSGTLTPAGVTLQVVGDPTDLPNGTFTGTVIVTISSGSSGAKTSNATTTVSVPISISLVTPIKPGNNSAPPANALIIPSVGHLDGVNTKWQSDVRLANPTATKQTYALTFTPNDPTQGVKTTTITVASNDTTALDDIVRNWYGVGTLGESANGVLLIVPTTASGSNSAGVVPNTVSVQTVAVASSRTYDVTSSGTLGQFIPAIPFSSFIDKNAAALSLQQIAQNDAFRTNLGLVEGSGNPATVLLSVFSNSGGKLLSQSIDLKANEQKQLNAFLATNGITLADGRVEVKVTAGTGKVTAYASVVDNETGDPLLVSGVPVGAASNHFVLPGVAALNNGVANWRSDVRIYNSGASPQAATLTLYPLNSTSAPVANSIVLDAGEVRSLDDIVKSYFSQDNSGGSLHVTTAGDSPLVVSGRTYNLTANGTYGQFISAVTPNDGVGVNDRALSVLQVEDSVRYRTNLGIAELTGNPATVEVSVFLPDSKVIPKVQFSLQANEYRQTAILHDLGLSNIYNARISVRVIDGTGKVTAYGSVVDMETQDPTYVPAQ